MREFFVRVFVKSQWCRTVKCLHLSDGPVVGWKASGSGWAPGCGLLALNSGECCWLGWHLLHIPLFLLGPMGVQGMLFWGKWQRHQSTDRNVWCLLRLWTCILCFRVCHRLWWRCRWGWGIILKLHWVRILFHVHEIVVRMQFLMGCWTNDLNS